jgi:hypothetical protein
MGEEAGWFAVRATRVETPRSLFLPSVFGPGSSSVEDRPLSPKVDEIKAIALKTIPARTLLMLASPRRFARSSNPAAFLAEDTAA